MPVSRRRFLRSGALGALTAGLVFKSGNFAFGSDAQSLDLQSTAFDYSRANFKSHVGSTFRFRQGKQTIDLKLVRLADYQPRSNALTTAKTRATESFVLAFRAPRALPRSSAAYQLEHPALGKFDLFMTGSEERGRIFYTAVINRI